MKALFIAFFLFATYIGINAQEAKKEAQKAETKMEAFSSKAGTIIKFIDTKLPDLKLTYNGYAETRIRKIIKDQEAQFFYQIEAKGSDKSGTASIAYDDLLEVIKAIKTLKDEVGADIQLSPDYLENRFKTSDDFELGYYVDKGKASWYLKLEKYGSNTLFIKDSESIEPAFVGAKNKIEELKK